MYVLRAQSCVGMTFIGMGTDASLDKWRDLFYFPGNVFENYAMLKKQVLEHLSSHDWKYVFFIAYKCKVGNCCALPIYIQILSQQKVN